ncbi:GNAT family N-acetyltransferase [Psychroflexus planctonicus]|uniref:N-acetyltransferase n=1 Tax=Psychroflexus planctonicus TaxID=1526575 RepID=A0ABQ1SGB5_9FLAO|nr:GNAT family N-acetyltransferase [Psychroflexus planctonicus]GGE29318.1 N-acetyltransferase [Psychroflexus planctonicus]
MNSIKIRSIQAKDNPEIAKVIREVLIGLGVPKVGTAYADPSLDSLHEDYQDPRSNYFVFEGDQKILGGAGIAPLSGENDSICELQKMYFLDQARGKGWGQMMMDKCLTFAQENNFKEVYIETLPSMKAAQNLYLKNGFEYIDKRLGNTGHFSCTVWMLKKF